MKKRKKKKRIRGKVIFVLILCILGTTIYWNRNFLFLMYKGYSQDSIQTILKKDNLNEYLDLDYEINIEHWDKVKNNGNYYDYDLYENQQKDKVKTIVKKVDYLIKNLKEFKKLGYTKKYIRKNLTKYSLTEWKVFLENKIQYEDARSYLKVKNRIISDLPQYVESKKEPIDAVMSISYPFINSEITPTQIYQIDDTEKTSILVKYGFQLPADYEPDDLVETNLPKTNEATSTLLRKEASQALMDMASAASQEGLTIGIRSAYRSYDDQAMVYEEYLNLYGEEYVRNYVAIPGFSEHQTGLAVDLTSASVINEEVGTFGETDEYDWVIENGYKYGFVLRYPEDKTNITGSANEPWHFRYVGIEMATIMHNENLTLEEYIQKYGFDYSISSIN